jgi:predicted phosphoribosyltransferase/dienelactone hydrolase
MMFDDRSDAGRKLSDRVRHLAAERPIVFAVPRGGVPVAVEVAAALDAPLDVLIVRKLGAPQNPEFAVGAVAEDGTAVLNVALARRVGMSRAELELVVERETRELRRRVERFRHGRPVLDIEGRTVVVVDDGLATGLTDLAAVRALRSRGAARIVVAVPVGSQQAVAMLGKEADEVVCLAIPDELRGVGEWYRDFSPVGDEHVLTLLAGTSAQNSQPSERLADLLHEQVLEREQVFDLGAVRLRGDLAVPANASGLMIFAHGSGSSRLSERNRSVARVLNREGLATLLFDLLSEEEDGRRDLVFDVAFLAERLQVVTRWALQDPATCTLPIGYFGASTGAAAALIAAAELGELVGAVVSRGGRPDLAANRLAQVRAPTLLIVGSLDTQVLDLNQRAAAALRCPHEIAVVDGAGHLFEEPRALEDVSRLASAWFVSHLRGVHRPLIASGS